VKKRVSLPDAMMNKFFKEKKKRIVLNIKSGFEYAETNIDEP
jgi:hypothetical protein